MRLYFRLVILVVLLSFTIACDKNLGTPLEGNSRWIGKWKLTEAYISAGGPQYWVDVENGEEFEFFEDGTFSSDRFDTCSEGRFIIQSNELSLKYDCDEIDRKFKNADGFITYTIEFENDYFILTPSSGPICIEGCSYKYKKL
ncbi:hypothetical protein [Pseudozobellia sp. WGM2]|uniref:hypothetical protein n=1 Tax=Pseudozobellia sp. WGM2 TaxID=2787625 RepID=UPI001AE06E33|nr:hypothetical protein [Pseudozobellia sp. WGM2]